MEKLNHFFQDFLEVTSPVRDFFKSTIITIGKTEISLLWIIMLVFSVVFLFYISDKIKTLLVNKILRRSKKMDSGLADSIGILTKYVILIIGFFTIIQTTGIDLSALGFIAGALGVGIGFGLQNITNNFISGLIILFERPIKVGDRVQVGTLEGNIVEIAARSTTVLTNDNISVIVPNASFIEKEVINWSHNDRKVRLKFPVGVSYKEDPRLVRKVLLEVAEENHGVLTKPSPDILFDSFGDSSLNFEMVVWTTNYIERPKILRSQIYYAVFKKLKEHNIEIPFPQRDLHIKSGYVPREISKPEGENSKESNDS